MKKLLIISSVLFLSYNSISQQQYVFTNFMMNDYYYNAAVAGSKDVHFANIGFRSQWAGFDEAPVTMYANYYGSVNNEQKHGYGLSIINDRSGLVSNTGFLLNYAYHVKLNEKQKLGFGIRPGYQQYNVKLYNAQLADQQDPILSGNVLSTGAFDFQAGINWYSDKFFVMASMRHMFGRAITFTGFNDGLAKHYSAIAGYKWIVNKQKPKLDADGNVIQTEVAKIDSTGVPQKIHRDFELMPVIMINYVGPITPQASIMVRGTYDNKYWAGISYRTQDAIGLSLGMVIKKRLHIGYSFDYSLGNIQAFNTGSHEIMISFQTTSKKQSLDDKDEELNNSIFDENKNDKK